MTDLDLDLDLDRVHVRPVTAAPGPSLRVVGSTAHAVVPVVVAQRLGLLLDSGWQVREHGGGVVVVVGSIRGTSVVSFATDSSVQGGALGSEGCGAIVRAIELAAVRGVPVVGVWHSGGARLREGVASLDGVARVFAAITRASGRVPQISVVLGPAAGGAAYGPALTDVVVMGPDGRLFVTGPDVIRRVTGEQVSADRLGGSETHTTRSGVAHLQAATDFEALSLAGRLVGLLGDQGVVDPTDGAGPDPGLLVPGEHHRAYDVRPVVQAVLDPGSVVELQPQWSRNAVTALGRLGGRTVGVVANDPATRAGCLDAQAGDKTGRFVQCCDSLGVPLLFLVDVPGYLPGLAQEDLGVVRRGAKLLHAYAAARVPRLTVVLRKSFGGAFIAMGSKGLGADHVFAWPGAEVDVMAATSAVEVLHRRDLAAEHDPQARQALLAVLATRHRASTGGLAGAVGDDTIDAVVQPHQTRQVLLAALAALPQRRGERHANGPL